jgi:hypothetical protein
MQLGGVGLTIGIRDNKGHTAFSLGLQERQ